MIPYDYIMGAEIAGCGVPLVSKLVGPTVCRTPLIVTQIVGTKWHRRTVGPKVPKFLKDDLPLFYNIISDLFPGVEKQGTSAVRFGGHPWRAEGPNLHEHMNSIKVSY